MNAVLDALAEYISVLEASAETTGRAEDRRLYQRHLAEAAGMFLAAYERDSVALKHRIDQERHGYGRSFLSGDEGTRAEAAFASFADAATRGMP